MSEQPEPSSDQPPSSTASGEATPAAAAPAGHGSRSGLPTSTIVVGAILIAVVGFGVGFLVGHRTARPAFPFARYARIGTMPWMRSGVMPGSGMPGAGGYGTGSGTMPGLPSSDRFVAGTVTGVQGDSFTVQTVRGDTVTVVTSSSTVVRRMDGGTLSALQPGDRVLVAGVSQADGTIAATHVLEGLFGGVVSPVPGAPTSSANA